MRSVCSVVEPHIGLIAFLALVQAAVFHPWMPVKLIQGLFTPTPEACLAHIGLLGLERMALQPV